MSIITKKIKVSQYGNAGVLLATKKVEERLQQKEWKHKRAKKYEIFRVGQAVQLVWGGNTMRGRHEAGDEAGEQCV